MGLPTLESLTLPTEFVSESILLKLSTALEKEKKKLLEKLLRTKHGLYFNREEMWFGINKGVDKMQCNQKNAVSSLIL